MLIEQFWRVVCIGIALFHVQLGLYMSSIARTIFYIYNIFYQEIYFFLFD